MPIRRRGSGGPKGQENSAQALAWVAPTNGDRPHKALYFGAPTVKNTRHAGLELL
jgi:hypothetical protein